MQSTLKNLLKLRSTKHELSHELRSLSQRCEFADSGIEIMLHIVLYGTSSRLKKHALHDPKTTLENLLYSGRPTVRT